MDWYRTDVDWPRDPKILKAGADGTLLFFAALAFTAEQETDGRIPKDVIPILVPRVLVIRPDRSAKAVTRAGLWAEDGDDFVIANFTKKNPTHDQAVAMRAAAEDRRETERKRKADWRAKKGLSRDVPGSVPPDVPGNVPPDVPRDVPGFVPPIVPPLDTGRDGTLRNEDPGSDSEVGLDLEGGFGGKPDFSEEAQVTDLIRSRFGASLTDDQLHNLDRLTRENRTFADVWPGTFEGRTMAVVSESLIRARTRDVVAVDHPRAWLESLMDEVAAELAPKSGPKTGPNSNGSGPKTVKKTARKSAKS